MTKMKIERLPLSTPTGISSTRSSKDKDSSTYKPISDSTSAGPESEEAAEGIVHINTSEVNGMKAIKSTEGQSLRKIEEGASAAATSFSGSDKASAAHSSFIP